MKKKNTGGIKASKNGLESLILVGNEKEIHNKEKIINEAKAKEICPQKKYFVNFNKNRLKFQPDMVKPKKAIDKFV